MSLLEKGWFKNKDEKKSLEQVITATTAERTREIKEHIDEENKKYTGQMDMIRWQIQEIDDKIQAAIDSTSNQESDLEQIKAELEGTTRELSNRFEEYAQMHPEFQKNVQAYQIAAKQLQEIVSEIQNKTVTDEVVTEYETRKYTLKQQLNKIKNLLQKEEDIEESTLPQVLN